MNKGFLLLLLLFAVSLYSRAQDDIHPDMKDGIYYSVNTTKKTAKVIAPFNMNGLKEEYTGEIVIPETISFMVGGAEYLVTEISPNAFKNNKDITAITIPGTVDVIEHYSFRGCDNLQTVTIKYGVRRIEGYDEEYGFLSAFGKCYNLRNLYFDSSVTHNTNGKGGLVLEKYAFEELDNLTNVHFGNSMITYIGESAFSHCSNLQSIVIPNSVTDIGLSAFFYCPSLESISVNEGNPKYDSRDNCNAIIETSTNTLLQGCNNTVIPNSVQKIEERAFWGSHILSSIVLPESITSIGCLAFSSCKSLKNITLPSKLESIGRSAFSDCTGLENIEIPKSVTDIGDFVFNGCFSLESISVKEGNSKYDSRDNCNAIIETSTNTLLQGCKNTIIPNSVQRIGDSAFWGCEKLTYIDIPASVKEIGEYAFRFCTMLKTIMIPESVTTLGRYVLLWCDSLKTIYCQVKDPSDFNSSAFDAINNNNGADVTIYIPIGTSDLYKSKFTSFEGNFVESDFSGIGKPLFDDKQQDVIYYNQAGQRINKPERGIVIVRNPNGTSRKLLIK